MAREKFKSWCKWTHASINDCQSRNLGTEILRLFQTDKLIGARFYYILSEVIEKNLRETLEEIFPGED